jgi:hypothetical protein
MPLQLQCKACHTLPQLGQGPSAMGFVHAMQGTSEGQGNPTHAAES